MLTIVVTPYEAYVFRSLSMLSRVWNFLSCTRSTVLPTCACMSISPGITNAPFRSVTSAPSGASRRDWGPTHVRRPPSMTIAAGDRTAWSPPSISVKLRRTRASPAGGAPTRIGIEQLQLAPPEPMQLSATSARTSAPLRNFGAGIFENALRARRVEDAAGAEARQRRRALLRRAPVFLDEVDHLLRQRVADHAVPAHRGQQHDLRVRHLVGLPFEAERVADAVPRNPRVLAAVLRAGDRRGHVDAEAEVLVLDPLDEFLRLVAVVENRRARRHIGQAVYHRLEVRPVVAGPVRERTHLPRRPNRAAVPRVAEIDGTVFDGNLQEPPQPVQRVLLLERPLARHRKHDEIIVKALGAAESVECVGHSVFTSG